MTVLLHPHNIVHVRESDVTFLFFNGPSELDLLPYLCPDEVVSATGPLSTNGGYLEVLRTNYPTADPSPSRLSYAMVGDPVMGTYTFENGDRVRSLSFSATGASRHGDSGSPVVLDLEHNGRRCAVLFGILGGVSVLCRNLVSRSP
jgi:hypothetical protein